MSKTPPKFESLPNVNEYLRRIGQYSETIENGKLPFLEGYNLLCLVHNQYCTNNRLVELYSADYTERLRSWCIEKAQSNVKSVLNRSNGITSGKNKKHITPETSNANLSKGNEDDHDDCTDDDDDDDSSSHNGSSYHYCGPVYNQEEDELSPNDDDDEDEDECRIREVIKPKSLSPLSPIRRMPPLKAPTPVPPKEPKQPLMVCQDIVTKPKFDDGVSAITPAFVTELVVKKNPARFYIRWIPIPNLRILSPSDDFDDATKEFMKLYRCKNAPNAKLQKRSEKRPAVGKDGGPSIIYSCSCQPGTYAFEPEKVRLRFVRINKQDPVPKPPNHYFRIDSVQCQGNMWIEHFLARK